jgi:hypothetical protein
MPATAYTPTTTAPITNYIPVLLTAASGVARFDHNPITFESLGLLIEEQRTNLCLQSEDFSTNWGETTASVQTNVLVAPNGLLTADKFVEGSGSVTPVLAQNISVTSGTSYTFSVYAKEDPTSAKRYLTLLLPSTQFGANVRITVNLGNGTLVSNNSPDATSIVAVGNGWYRCSVTKAATGTGTVGVQLRISNVTPDTLSTYTGDGYSGIYIWGAQLEAGAFPTSYIPTVAATVTRNADAASMTGANFTSWFRADEGTLYAEAAYVGLVVSRAIVSINDNTTTNLIQIQTNPSTATSSRFLVLVNNTNQAALGTASVFAAGSFGKHAAVYKPNDFAFTSNGSAVLTDTDGILPVVTQLQLGAYATVFSNVHIRKVAYYPIRATNAQLQALTS